MLNLGKTGYTPMTRFLNGEQKAEDAARLADACTMFGKPWAQFSALHKPDVVVHSKIQKLETEGSEVQGHPWLHSKFKLSLGYTRPNLKKTKHKMVVCVYTMARD